MFDKMIASTEDVHEIMLKALNEAYGADLKENALKKGSRRL